ncbi:MAG: peptidylprolyl isomerase, partial [Sphingomonadaceae bacterium]|nr:peptidylprolyl isomerase [Sphingomonadaceae bacterium]
MKRLLTLALVALAMPVVAQTSAPAVPTEGAAPAVEAPPAPKPATVRVTLTTAEGPILLELEKERAPVTTANFLRYVDQKRFDGAVFYRAMKLTPDGSYGLIQGGTRGSPKTTLPAIRHEPTSTTGLSHVDGTISMARGAPGSATGDFFITIGAL